MHSIQTILHPTDFSDSSEYAFGMACSLAEKFKARLILLHVLPFSSLPIPGEQSFKPLDSAELQDTLKAQCTWPQALNRKISVEQRVAAGDAAEQIRRIAKSRTCDLIVMGTHGRTGLKRVLVGSVAEGVLRTAVCPVLTVKRPDDFASPTRGIQSNKPDEDKRGTLRIQTILHPTDFSPHSDYAFEVACSLAEVYATRLILLHVIPPSSLPFLGAQPSNPLESAEAQGAVKGRYAWPQPLNKKISVEHRVAEGDSPDEILGLGHIANCDLIVMGTHGRTGLQRVLMGSVAEEVLRKARCPVLTVKTPPDWSSSVQYSSSSKPCEIVDVRPLGAASLISAQTKITLLRTDDMEVIRLAVPERKTISESMAKGEAVFQCLEGKVAFTACGKTLMLEAGKLLYLPRGEFFTIEGVEDASLLLTILLPKG